MQVACGNGHFYNDEQHANCPFCGLDDSPYNNPPTSRPHLIHCERGHFYNSEHYASYPFCGLDDSPSNKPPTTRPRLIQCQRGHFYDQDAYDTCPHCGDGAIDLNIPQTASSTPGNVTNQKTSAIFSAALPIGTVLDSSFRIDQVLGYGGFGISYLARDERLETPVVIKEYLPRDLATRAANGTSILPHSEADAKIFHAGLNAFIEEARILARLDHPNIARVRQFFEANGSAYFVMDYYRGITLAKYLDKQTNARIQEKVALSLMSPVLDALEAVHTKGFLHRDIKPGNIYLASLESGGVRPILLDFGAARQIVGERSRSLSVVLSEGYAPFEQYHRKGKQGPWTDVYGTAAVLYRMLTGHAPISAVERISGESLPPASAFHVSIDISHAIEQALAIDPSHRTQTINELRRALIGTPQPNAERTPPICPDGSKPRLMTSVRPWPQLWNRLRQLLLPSRPRHSENHTRPFRDDVIDTPSSHPDIKQDSVRAEYRNTAPPVDETGNEAHPIHGATTQPVHQKTATMPAPAIDRAFKNTGANHSTQIGPNASRDALLQTLGQEEVQTGILSNRFDATRCVWIGSTSSDSIPTAAIIIEESKDASRVRETILIDRSPFFIGRADEANLKLNDDSLSRLHLEISAQGSKFFARDLDSANGTLINGCTILGGFQAPLLTEDSLQLGATVLRFVLDVPSMPDLEGHILNGRYLLGRCMYRSVRAATHEAEDRQLPRKVAIKLFSPFLNSVTHDSEDFAHQANVSAKLMHPNIGSVIDSGLGPMNTRGSLLAYPYICMPFFDGGTLSDALARNPAPALDDVAAWIEGIAKGLDYAHSQDVVHGGIKPGCILFNSVGNPLLTDFALRRGRGSFRATLLGAPAFLAPEQWEGKEPGPASDQYSLAAIAYLLITGARPFEGLENPEIRKRQFARGPAPAHEETKGVNRSNVSSKVSCVLAKGLDQDPSNRYSSATDFAGALREALTAVQPATAVRVFISYQRSASRGWPTFFSKQLKVLGADVFVDTQRFDRIGRFPERLAFEIEKCDVFVCLLGKSTLTSDWVRHEVKLAHSLNKPMIPVFQQDFDRTAYKDIDRSIESLLEFDAVYLFDFDDHLVEAAVASLGERVIRFSK